MRLPEHFLYDGRLFKKCEEIVMHGREDFC